mmetsp:Transcript_6793/g.13791  ORF Transcript_6793/g.13791 Transcript_6793/m.13791 type:complete len:143 (+) Transcript_6793:43-471(+)
MAEATANPFKEQPQVAYSKYATKKKPASARSTVGTIFDLREISLSQLYPPEQEGEDEEQKTRRSRTHSSDKEDDTTLTSNEAAARHHHHHHSTVSFRSHHECQSSSSLSASVPHTMERAFLTADQNIPIGPATKVDIRLLLG